MLSPRSHRCTSRLAESYDSAGVFLWGVMLFILSVHDDERRVILDDDVHGDVLAVIEASTWIDAREDALKETAMDPYDYKTGYGWVLRACHA